MAVQTLVSVKKPESGAGRPKGKRSYVILFEWEDVKPMQFSEDGVSVSKLEFLSGKKPVGVYATPDTIICVDKLAGETDSEGYLHLVSFNTPGDTKELSAFRKNAVNKNLGAITIDCIAKEAKLAGTPCSPLRFKKDEGKDDKDAVRREIELGNNIPVDPILRIPISGIPQTGDPDIDGVLGLTASPEAGSIGG